jgi:hypothetical protein
MSSVALVLPVTGGLQSAESAWPRRIDTALLVTFLVVRGGVWVAALTSSNRFAILSKKGGRVVGSRPDPMGWGGCSG